MNWIDDISTYLCQSDRISWYIGHISPFHRLGKALATVKNDKPLDKRLFIRKAKQREENEFNLISRSCIIFPEARG